MGLITALAFLVQPPELVIHAIAGGGLLLYVVACLRIARHYRDTYGTVTLSARRQVRSSVGGGLVVVILLLGSIQAGPLRVLPWSAEDSAVSTFTAAAALAMLVYCAVAVALRTHHVVIWGSVLAVSLLPIWGGLGPDDRWGRGALAWGGSGDDRVGTPGPPPARARLPVPPAPEARARPCWRLTTTWCSTAWSTSRRGWRS